MEERTNQATGKLRYNKRFGTPKLGVPKSIVIGRFIMPRFVIWKMTCTRHLWLQLLYKGLTPWWQVTTFYTGFCCTPYMCRCINALPAWCSDPFNSWISWETRYPLAWLSTADVTHYPMMWLSTRWRDLSTCWWNSALAHVTQHPLMPLSNRWCYSLLFMFIIQILQCTVMPHKGGRYGRQIVSG